MVKTTINSQTKYKLVMVLLLTTFIAIIFCLYYLKGLAANLVTNRINIAETERDIVLLDKIIKEKSQYTSDINKVKNTLPSKYYEVAFITTQIEALAQRDNLAIQTSIDQKATEEKGSYSSITYSLILNGSFSSVSEFLSQVAKLPYHTSIDDLKMSVEGGGLVSDIKMRLYIQK